MSGVYSMWSPTYQRPSRQALFDSAMDQPLSLTSTLLDQAKGGVLESYGLGTVIRETQLPDEAPTEEGVVVGPEGSQTTVPNSRTLQRRITAFGDLANVHPETAPEFERRRADAGALNEDQYKASPYFRKDIPYDPGMTEARAAALASMDDAKKVRQFYAQKRPFSAFIGNLAGQAFDPINYIPIAGPAIRAAAVSRFGKVAGTAAFSSFDAAANTALFGIGTAGERAQFGDDVSWQSTVSQIATAALIGSAFGAVGGAVGSRVDARVRTEAEQRLATLKTTQEARIALNEGIDALVRGEDIRLSPNATEPMARVAGDIQQSAPIQSVDPATSALIATEADTALRNAGYDLTKLAEQGRDVNTVMRAASAEEAAKAVQTQEITSLKERVAAMQAEKPVENAYGPGLLRTQNAEPTAQVYDSGMGAVTVEEHAVQLAATTEKLATIEGHAAKGTVAPEYVQAIEFGRKSASPVSAPPLTVSRISPAPRAAVDTTSARLDPLPNGLKQAEVSIAKPDDAKALAAQYRVDPQTGSFAEEAEVAQLAAEGRLTETDVATMAQAQSDFENGAAYAEALKSVAGCLL